VRPFASLKVCRCGSGARTRIIADDVEDGLTDRGDVVPAASYRPWLTNDHGQSIRDLASIFTL
jgi:hypothetical protein